MGMETSGAAASPAEGHTGSVIESTWLLLLNGDLLASQRPTARRTNTTRAADALSVAQQRQESAERANSGVGQQGTCSTVAVTGLDPGFEYDLAPH